MIGFFFLSLIPQSWGFKPPFHPEAVPMAGPMEPQEMGPGPNTHGRGNLMPFKKWDGPGGRQKGWSNGSQSMTGGGQGGHDGQDGCDGQDGRGGKGGRGGVSQKDTS